MDNVFSMLMKALSLAFADENWILGLLFCVLTTALIVLLTGWLWGRLWNASWSLKASLSRMVVVCAFSCGIFAALVMLHSLSGYQYGYVSDFPTEADFIAGNRLQLEQEAEDASSADEDVLPRPVESGAMRFCRSVVKALADDGVGGESQDDTAMLRSVLNQYEPAYYVALFLLVASWLLMGLSVAWMAYTDIKLIELHRFLR